MTCMNPVTTYYINLANLLTVQLVPEYPLMHWQFPSAPQVPK